MEAKEKIVAWIPEYAAYLLNRLHRAKDGKTVYERVRGKDMSVPGIEFAERVMYKLKQKNKLRKLKARWTEGIFIGIKSHNNEFRISRTQGITHARSVRRIADEKKRWSEDNLSWIRTLPWQNYRCADDAEGGVGDDRVEGESAPEGGRQHRKRIVIVITREKVPRELGPRAPNIPKTSRALMSSAEA